MSASWVVVDKETGTAIFETFNKKLADIVNTKKYQVAPIMQYLQSLNERK